MKRLLILATTILAVDVANAASTAFFNVNVIPMTEERVIPGQTVIVEDGVIALIGDVDDVPARVEHHHRAAGGQIIAEHESRGENVLPIEVLTDLVRSYTTQAQSVVPQFLAMSFEMLREGQSKMMENFANPMGAMPGFEAMKASQAAFVKAMTGGMAGWPSGPSADEITEAVGMRCCGAGSGTPSRDRLRDRLSDPHLER